MASQPTPQPAVKAPDPVVVDPKHYTVDTVAKPDGRLEKLWSPFRISIIFCARK